MADPMRVLRTLRGLRWQQWAYRPLRRVQARLGAPAAPAPAPRDEARAAAMTRVWEAAGPPDGDALRRADGVLRGRFEFIGHAEELPAPAWTARPVSPLWTYNLHYFDYATDLAWAFRSSGNAAYARRFQELAEGWIGETAGGSGPGWEPYTLSLRAVNWMRARLLFGPALEAGFAARLDASLHGQFAFLRRRLEWHVLANHLQKNLHALVLGGLYFTGPEAAGWRGGVLELLWRELREQVLADGGHFERSPMYHAIALGDFLEALALLGACGVAIPGEARERVRRMAAAWPCLARRDGTPHLFNDAAAGVAPGGAWLEALASPALGSAPAPPRGAWALPETGFYGWAD
ncbi:MAG TPA: heparinase II/III family protein, partial [Longimicrobium sp.]|nr:heparinase II/III family protein [Longimicrobium sp.]